MSVYLKCKMKHKGTDHTEFMFNIEVYKATCISESLESRKIMNCIVLSIILNYIICRIKLWLHSVLYMNASTKP